MWGRWLLRIRTNLSVNEWYWQLRSAYLRLGLQLATTNFRFRLGVTEVRRSLAIYLFLISSVVRSVLVASLFMVLLLFASRFVGGTTSPDNSATYDGLLTSVATFAGVFLGFYFTGLNTVAGSAYSKMPERVRELLFEERVNDLSTAYVVFLTTLSVLALAVGAATGARPTLVVYTLAVLGIVAIPVFVQLSKRVFFFFDPTSLSNYVLHELREWHTKASVDGFRWNDPNFQKHYQRKAAYNADTVKALVEVANKEEYLQGEPLVRLVKKLNTYLVQYIDTKKRIPARSHWYRRKAEFPMWYLAGESQVSIASSTSTSLMPDQVPDIGWLDSDLIDLGLNTLANALVRSGGKSGAEILGSYRAVMSALGAAWTIDGCLAPLTRIWAAVDSYCVKVRTSQPTPQNAMLCLELVHLASLLPIDALLGFRNSLEALGKLDIDRSIHGAHWRSPKTIYSFGLPRRSVERLEEMQSHLSFEAAVEDTIATPKWYVSEWLANSLAAALQPQLEHLILLGRRCYLETARERISMADWQGASSLLLRGQEYVDKLLVCLREAESAETKWKTLKKSVHVEWPAFNWDKQQENARALWGEMAQALASCVVPLSEGDWDSDAPDLFGHALHVVGSECFELLSDNKPEDFRELFPAFFDGSQRMALAIAKRTVGYLNAATFMVAPIVDLVDLSGFSMLFAEFHQDHRCFEVVKKCWDSHLSGDQRQQRLAWLAFAISHNENLFAIAPRSIQRDERGRYFQSLLRRLPMRDAGPQFAGYSLSSMRRPIHSSLMIRSINVDDWLPIHYYSGTDVFVDQYFSSLDDARDLDFGLKRRISEAMDRTRKLEAEDDLDAQEESE